jgi:hypothetical protein
MEPVLVDAAFVDPTLYCFSVVMQDTGSTKKYYDLELVQGAYDKGIGIFGCDFWGVFSDAEADLAPGVPITKVDDVDGDFHFMKREETGTWLNTGLHYQAWKAIQAEGKYAAANWVVKLDADAVMITSRLKYWLSDKPVPPGGMYLENCQYVEYGYFGSLEIFSAAAFEKLLGTMASCKDGGIDWKVGIHGGKYGPMGEDLFAQACLDKSGVMRGIGYGSKLDGTCEADRPLEEKKNKKFKPGCDYLNTTTYHPFMKPDDWWTCYEATTKAFGS